jgi:hypothetical protein
MPRREIRPTSSVCSSLPDGAENCCEARWRPSALCSPWGSFWTWCFNWFQSHQPSLAVDTAPAKPSGKNAARKDSKSPWPKALSDRVKAVSAALATSGAPVSPADLAARFSRARPGDIAEILETLCTMGHAHRGKPKGTYLP